MDWWLTKDGDKACLELYEQHYSCYRYRDGRKRVLFVGTGDKIVLRTEAGDALFVWRKFRDACIDHRTGRPQEGINCAAFRNVGELVSSELIRQADAIADCIWPNSRHYTYVNPRVVQSGLPGCCFLAAGWRYVRRGRHRVQTKRRGLLIMERNP